MERQRLIDRYREGPVEVDRALDGIVDAELDFRIADGEWTPREVVHHLADSEMTSAIRIRRLIAEDEPVIVGYDQEEFARKLSYGRPIAGSLLALAGARASTADLLEQFQESDWTRFGTHSEYPEPFTVIGWLEYYAEHAHDHADQIRRSRAAYRDR
ncbi:MAG: DinB family protein [Thermomicrobiales bacterium]|nr:DinB family protein [Thermomicrobiales bacterium]